MKTLSNIKRNIERNKPLSYYLIIAITLVLIFFTIKSFFINQALQTSIIQHYAQFTINQTFELLSWFGFNIHGSNIILPSEHPGILYIDISFMSLRHLFLFCLAVLFMSLKNIQKLLIIITGILILHIFNVIRVSFVTISINYWTLYKMTLVKDLFYFILNIAFIIGFYYWFKRSYSIKKFLIKAVCINKVFLRGLFKRIIYVLLFISLFNLIYHTLFDHIGLFISTGILKASQFLLSIFGYVTYIVKTRILQGTIASIYLADACLGINLMLNFATFIVIVGGKIKHMIWYITGGIVLIYFLNILRITLLFIYIHHHNGYYNSSFDIHDMYNYVVYIATLLMWIVWINKFRPMNEILVK